MTRRYLLIVLGLVFSFHGMALGPALAQAPETDELAILTKDLEDLEKALEKSTISDSDVDIAGRLGAEIRRQSSLCIATIKTENDRIKALIGETPGGENGTGDRNAKTAELEANLGICQDIALRVDSANGKLDALKRQRQAEKFGTRGRNVIDMAAGAFSAKAQWNSVLRPIAGLVAFPREPTRLDWVLILGSMLLGGGLGWRLRNTWFNGARYAPVVTGLTGLMTGLTFAYAASSVEAIVIGWRLLAILCLIQLSASLPRPAAEPDRIRTGWRVGGFLFAALASYHLSLAFDNALPIPEVETVRLLVIVLVFAAAVPATRHIRFLPIFEWAWKPIRALFLIGFSLALIAELAGYRALATFLLTGFTGTLAAVILYSLVARGGEAVITSLNSGNTAWSVAVKGTFGFDADKPVPGLLWMRLFFEALVFGGFALGVATAWGLSEAGRELLIQYAVDGFQIWDIKFVPGRIIGGILLFSLLLMASRRVRDIAERRWTVDLKLAPGGREALVTLIGYGGIILAVIAGLSWAGFSFDKLALVAGALSVGIGFGLQNVVSNFVSGLILLFEQPIRNPHRRLDLGRDHRGHCQENPRARHRNPEIRPHRSHRAQCRFHHQLGDQLHVTQQRRTHFPAHRRCLWQRYRPGARTADRYLTQPPKNPDRQPIGA